MLSQMAYEEVLQVTTNVNPHCSHNRWPTWTRFQVGNVRVGRVRALAGEDEDASGRDGSCLWPSIQPPIV